MREKRRLGIVDKRERFIVVKSCYEPFFVLATGHQSKIWKKAG
jgi:hypothetical protein